MIEAEAGWEICGEASDGRESVALVEQLHPDIAVLDIGMPQLNGLEAARQIKRAHVVEWADDHEPGIGVQSKRDRLIG